MFFYFEIGFIICCFTAALILLCIFGKKKREFEDIVNPKTVSFKQTRIKLFK